MSASNVFEFYETPCAFTDYLLGELGELDVPVSGRIFEPCVGSGAIQQAIQSRLPSTRFFNNDIDARWLACTNQSAAEHAPWIEAGIALGGVDWTITNPPFTLALEIAELALWCSRVGVAMHLRASIHEVLKTGSRRTWFAKHPPTGILWLPRFAYQRSPVTGKWTTDSICPCWVVWLKDYDGQFIRYAPESVLNALQAETPAYRERMDALMSGTLSQPVIGCADGSQATRVDGDTSQEGGAASGARGPEPEGSRAERAGDDHDEADVSVDSDDCCDCPSCA